MSLFARLAAYVDAAIVSDYDVADDEIAANHAAACEMAAHMADIRRAITPFDLADWEQGMAS